ncbi:MAG: four helix bundle protein, partial [Deltaproteobacteria bacterium]|nr:four helix bundle protein [Deltaproteobacteria bacterium]
LDHERLRVYQVAIAFAELALRIIERIPRGAGKLGDQLFRSSTSIPANIAEGVGKRAKAERRNYCDYRPRVGVRERVRSRHRAVTQVRTRRRHRQG